MNPEDVSHITAGHKANISNPNTSEESKQHSRAVLENELADAKMERDVPGDEKNPGNVLVHFVDLASPVDAEAKLVSAGGLKAAINNPNVSDEAKQSAKERLNDME